MYLYFFSIYEVLVLLDFHNLNFLMTTVEKILRTITDISINDL